MTVKSLPDAAWPEDFPLNDGKTPMRLRWRAGANGPTRDSVHPAKVRTKEALPELAGTERPLTQSSISGNAKTKDQLWDEAIAEHWK